MRRRRQQERQPDGNARRDDGGRTDRYRDSIREHGICLGDGPSRHGDGCAWRCHPDGER
jgi:hypothetical protein